MPRWSDFCGFLFRGFLRFSGGHRGQIGAYQGALFGIEMARTWSKVDGWHGGRNVLLCEYAQSNWMFVFQSARVSKGEEACRYVW